MSRAWMPLYIGDYRRDTGHLSTLEHGAYLLLIMHYWETGPLPADPVRLARIAGLTVKRFKPLWVSLRGFFTEANDKQLLGKCWRHTRIDRELEKSKNISTKRAMAGFKGGSASRGQTNIGRSLNQAIAKQTGTQSQSHISTASDQSAAEPQQGASEEASKGHPLQATEFLVKSLQGKRGYG